MVMLPPHALFLVLLIPTVLAECDHCKDDYSFCDKLSMEQCKLRVAQEHCPKKCRCCSLFPLPPEMPNPGCKDEFRNCTELFMNCGEDAEFEKGCQKTCEKCPLPTAKLSRGECEDTKSFCVTLKDSQCKLAISQQACPKRCGNCKGQDELAIRRSSVDGCGNYNDDCANAFYVCGVSNEYEMLCPKTCELCYTKDILDVNRELEKCEIIYGKYFCNRLIITCAKSVDQNFGRDSSEPKSIRVAKCLAAEDVFLLCTARHDAEYCNKLLSACSQVTNTPIPYPLPGQPGQLPEAIEKCISSEFSIALCYARNSPGVCQLWMKQCEIPSTNARLTHAQQQCMKNKDVVVVCKSKHSKMFCDKLGAACSQVTNTPIPEVGYGPEYMLPEAISLCIASEYYIAVCYVENGIQLCQLWMSYCYIYSIPTHLTPEQKNCMEEKKSLRLCYSRFGAQQCDRWSLLCKGVDSKGNMASSKAYKNCINSQVVLHKCKFKRGEIFCYKLEAACCAIFGVAVPSETVHILPQKVVNCIGSEDVVAVCRAEYDTAYCDKLIKACAELTGTSEQLTSSDSRHRLPHAVAICVASGNYIAFCYVRHGAQVCKDWMKVCKIQFWNGEITSAQKQCVENQNSIGHCYKDHGVEKCNRWTEMCKTLGLSTDPDSNDAYMICIDTQIVLYKCSKKYGDGFRYKLEASCCSLFGVSVPTVSVHVLPKNVQICISSEYPMAICGAKFDPELCNKLVVVCGQIFNVPIPEMTSISDYKLPTVIATCITTETYAAICYIRSGAEVCNRWMRACNIVITTGKLTIAQKQCVEEQGGALQTCISKHGVSFCYQLVITCSTMLGVTITGNRFEKIPRSILDCISTSDPLVLCKVKHGFDYCDRLRAACFEITGIQIQPGVLGNRLPDTVAKCISTGNIIAVCYVKNSAKLCDEWMRTCEIVYFTGPFTNTQKLCIETRMFISTCITRYGADKCTTWSKVCNIVDFTGKVTLTMTEMDCMKTQWVIETCVSKYSQHFCTKLRASCSSLLGEPDGADTVTILSSKVLVCMSTEYPMAICAVKYGVQFCIKLQTACSQLMNVPLVPKVSGSLDILLGQVATCITSENIIAICFVQYGENKCRQWMALCKIVNLEEKLTVIQTNCMNNNTNELKRCISKYGSNYCYQLILYCSRTLRVTLPPGPLQNIPLAIANCIFTDDPMILCKVKYGADYCNSLQNACSEVTGVTIPFYTTATKLPDEIAQCIITENVIAVCYAEDGDALCKAWMSACKIAIPKWQLSPIEIKCIKNRKFIAICRTRYGIEKCAHWASLCRVSNFGGDHLLSVNEQDCIRTQWVFETCILKYGKEFCDKLNTACSTLVGVTVSVGSVQIITYDVAVCITTENALATCMAKHGHTLCKKLLGTCSTILNLPLLPYTQGSLMKLPTAISVCISSENIIAMCYAEYGIDMCKKWMTECGISISQSAFSDEQTTCLKNKNKSVKNCLTKYGQILCYKLIIVCSKMLNVQIDRKSIENVSQAVLTCITSDDPMIICMAKHGTEFCNKLPAACAALTHLQIPQYTFGMKLPAAIAACISSENYIAFCYANNSVESCNVWLQACGITSINEILTSVQIQCMDTKIFIGFCKRRYGAEQCLSWSKKCAIIDYSGNVILTTDAKNCMITQWTLHTCAAKYGKDFCDKMQMTCASMLDMTVSIGIGRILPIDLAKCISEVNPMALCVTKYGADFCDKLQMACSEIVGVPILPRKRGTLQQFLGTLGICISTEHVIAMCYARNGVETCTIWMKACSITDISVPLTEEQKLCMKNRKGALQSCVAKYGASFCYKMVIVCAQRYDISITSSFVDSVPADIASCIFADDPIIICVSKYDVDFCKKLVVSCAEQAHLAVPEWSIRSSLPLPKPIATCIIKENYVAMCYARDGVTLCNTWFTACLIVNFELPFTEKQKNCVEIKKFTAYCHKNYGVTTCNKWWQLCKVVHVNGNEVLSVSDRECITTQWVLHTCVAKYGKDFCFKLETICLSMLGLSVPAASPRRFPLKLSDCIGKEHPIATCIAKYGPGFCNKVLKSCSELLNQPILPRTPGSLQEFLEPIAICISKEDPLAFCYARVGEVECNEWKIVCLKSIGGSEITVVVKDCIRTREVLSVCLKKHNEIFCSKLETACSQALGFPSFTGSMRTLNALVLQCIFTEHVIAMCIAKYDYTFCVKLEAACAHITGVKFVKHVPQTAYVLSEVVSQCIVSENLMAICFARHGAEKCVEWSKLCNVVDWKYFGALSDSDKQCLTSYITVHTCAAKYGKVFCSKMQSACYQILGETVRSGAVVLMPPNVAYCMTSEHYLAICYAKFGAAKCIQWRQICSIPINYKELMVSQEECVTSYVMIQSLVQNCQASSSQPFCTHVQQSCSAIGVKIVVKPTPPKLVLPQPTDVDMRLCYTKYGIVGCEEMLRKCFISPAMINIVLDGFKRDCLKRQLAMMACQMTFGNECPSLQAECIAGTGAPPITIDANRAYQMAASLRLCLEIRGIKTMCVNNNGIKQCNIWENQCAASLGISIGTTVINAYYKLSPPLATCLSTQVLMTKCISIFGLTSCKATEAECISRYGGPSRMLIPPLNTLTPPLISCIMIKLKILL